MTLSPASSRSGGAGSLFDSYAMYQDQKAAGTDGGATSTGSWIDRTLNTEVFDPDGIGTLAANAVTVGVGSYFFEAYSSFGSTGSVGSRNQIRIRDTTNNVTLGISPAQRPGSVAASVDNGAMCIATGHLVAVGSVAIKVQYQASQAVAGSGLGWAGNFGETEVFTTLMVYREA